MKATDFDLRRELLLNNDTGVATFRDSRVVVMDAGALGLLRNNLQTELGWEKARSFFLRFGYGQGYSDFQQMKSKFTFDTEMDLLASGPVIHTWEGIVSARPTEVRFDRKTGDFFFRGRWINSYEAEQYLCFNEPSKEPVCWSLVGYASGWSTAFFGKPLLAIEPTCAGKGDEECGFVIQSPEAHGAVAVPYMAALKSLMGG